MPRNRKMDVLPESELFCLYAGGWTQSQLAIRYGVGSSTIQRAFEYFGIPSRGRGNGPGANGAFHPNWRGKEISYKNAHKRVFRARGKASFCEVCGKDEPGKYEWANLSGNYHDVWDYQSMCVPCHRKFDSERRMNANC